jgi:hypothetical protein
VKITALQLAQVSELEASVIEGEIRMTNIKVHSEWLRKLKEAQEIDGRL